MNGNAIQTSKHSNVIVRSAIHSLSVRKPSSLIGLESN